MKLLFDQNLSPRLVDFISDIFPNSTHTNKIGLGKADDLEVWDYAHQNDYLIVSVSGVPFANMKIFTTIQFSNPIKT